MAIDPKELRIGSHVSFKKKRIKIVGIPYPNVYDNMSRDIYWRSEDDSHYIGVDCADERLTPIPITEKLLSELGLLKMEEHGNVSVWMNRNIRIDIIGERMTAMVGNDYNKCTINPIYFLHELETFLYLTTKQELIND